MKKELLHPITASINLKQKNESKRSRQKALAWLVQKFPKAFDTSEQILPLCIGIDREIMLYADEAAQSGISRSKLREALVIFTRRIDYLASLKSQDVRVNLDGSPSGVVSEEEAFSAAQKIKKRIEKNLRNTRKESNQRPIYQQETPIKKPAIVIKNKAAKSFDPTAVERLKNKLGLSKQAELID